MADLDIIRGDDLSIDFTYQDSDGNAIDLTGATVYLTIKSDIDDDATDTEAVITKDVSSHTDPTNGITVIALTDSDTDVATGFYVADIQVKDSGGDIDSSETFTVQVVGDITRRTT